MKTLAALLLAGCFHTLLPPTGALEAGGLPRVYRVADGLYRSPQPSEAQFRALVQHLGIRTVVKLNYEWEGRDDAPCGVDVVYEPIDVLADVSRRQLNRILDDIDIALERGPVLVHCSHGEDRTGLIVALWRLRHQPMLSAQAAAGEMIAYGFHDGTVNTPGLPELVDAFTAITGYRP